MNAGVSMVKKLSSGNASQIVLKDRLELLEFVTIVQETAKYVIASLHVLSVLMDNISNMID